MLVLQAWDLSLEPLDLYKSWVWWHFPRVGRKGQERSWSYRTSGLHIRWETLESRQRGIEEETRHGPLTATNIRELLTVLTSRLPHHEGLHLQTVSQNNKPPFLKLLQRGQEVTKVCSTYGLPLFDLFPSALLWVPLWGCNNTVTKATSGGVVWADGVTGVCRGGRHGSMASVASGSGNREFQW